MDKFKKILASSIFSLGILFLPSAVLAGTNIDVDFPDPPGPIITETNILPGDVFQRTVTVTKMNDTNQTLMMRFDADGVTEQYSLAKKMLVKIKRMSGTVEFVDMPNGTKEQTLEELYDYQSGDDDGAFDFDVISGSAGSTFPYQIQFTFDPLTDNNFQGKSTVFDISMGIFSESSNDVDDDDDDDDDGHKRHHQNQTTALVTGGLFSSILGGAPESSGEEVQGVTTPEEGGGIGEGSEIAGETATCVSWPLWVWILAFAVFILNFWRNARKNYKEEKYKWIFPFIWTFIAVVFWYFFDKCREYKWFLYLSLIGAILSHFIYLYMLKRKVNKGIDKIEEKQ
ncbi:MAG TPA: hypothetical protein PLK35_03390 [Candidatus Moranbacteria bacterium]|nr:hypothetical protein [Candidatus Moranbacteria bacterium]